MSVFKVNLQNSQQGLLDKTYNSSNTDGTQQTVSIQRTVYIPGPNRINYELADGATFTDCNYWKKFAYPQLPLDQAFIEVVTDDGSIYSDVASENTYLKVYTLSIASGSTYTNANNIADVLTDTGSYATFTQITNNGSQTVNVEVNGNSGSIFQLAASETQVFNVGDLTISKLAFDHTGSGASATVPVQILFSVTSVCNS